VGAYTGGVYRLMKGGEQLKQIKVLVPASVCIILRELTDRFWGPLVRLSHSYREEVAEFVICN
jgi:hypothetical protein